MAKNIDKLVEEAFVQMTEDIKKLDSGSEEHSRAVKDMMSMYSGILEREKARINEEDLHAKNAQSLVRNEAELQMKREALELDKQRAINDRENRNKNLILNFVDIAGRNFANAMGMRSMRQIYQRECLAQDEGLQSFDRDTMRIYDKIDRKIR